MHSSRSNGRVRFIVLLIPRGEEARCAVLFLKHDVWELTDLSIDHFGL